MSMQQASVFWFRGRDKFLIHGISKIKIGAGIASAPYIWLNGDTSFAEIIKQIFFALSQTKTGLPSPKDWDKSSKDFRDAIGLPKKMDLYKNNLLVGILKKDGVLQFAPMQNNGSKGFVNVSKEKIEIAESADIDEIGKALQLAFSKCK